MADNSGSRYGIINSLTTKKIELIEAADSLDSEVNEAKLKLEVSKKNLKSDQERITAEAENHIKVLKKEIADLELEAKNKCAKVAREIETRAAEITIKEKNVQSKKLSIGKQIAAIDIALGRIESVSANASKE